MTLSSSSYRLIFCDKQVGAAQDDWLSVARYVVGTFRADAARAGAGKDMRQLVDELSTASAEFKALWQDNEIIANSDGVKRIHHPKLGLIDLEFSSFAVEGRPDLIMMVYYPTMPATVERVKALMTRA